MTMVCLSGKENEVLVRYDKVCKDKVHLKGGLSGAGVYLEYLKCMTHGCMKRAHECITHGCVAQGCQELEVKMVCTWST